MDNFLKKRFELYVRWMKKGQISHSSKVVPLYASVQAKQWIIPTSQATQRLRGAESIAVSNCECRSHYERCKNPIEVCLFFDAAAEKLIRKREARRISAEEALEILHLAHKKGLVHLSLYRPFIEIYALCSCCACCCHDLQLLRDYSKKGLIAHSDYTATTDKERCSNCGICAEACLFRVRSSKDGELDFTDSECYGCGLCVTTCPEEAITLMRRAS